VWAHTIASSVLLRALVLGAARLRDGARDAWALRFAAQTQRLDWAGGRNRARHGGSGSLQVGRYFGGAVGRAGVWGNRDRQR
jgi:hypothetical protein